MKSKTIFQPGAMRHLSSYCHSYPYKAVNYQDDIVIIDVIGF